jgi:hypothetical protein
MPFVGVFLPAAVRRSYASASIGFNRQHVVFSLNILLRLLLVSFHEGYISKDLALWPGLCPPAAWVFREGPLYHRQLQVKRVSYPPVNSSLLSIFIGKE